MGDVQAARAARRTDGAASSCHSNPTRHEPVGSGPPSSCRCAPTWRCSAFSSTSTSGVASYDTLLSLARARRTASRSGLPDHPAARHQLLHLPVDELHDRRLPRVTPPRCGASSTSPATSRCFRSSWRDRSSGSRKWRTSCVGRTCTACTATKFARGVAFLSMGLAKKILLANPCGQIADLAFDAGSLRRARRLVWPRGLRVPDLL